MTDGVYADLNCVAERAEAAPLPIAAVDLNSVFGDSEVAHG
jgi:hypothetical protein